MITTFKIFEARIEDISFLKKEKPNQETNINYSHIQKNINRTFIKDRDLVETIYIDGEVLKFAWNHRLDHDIYTRIKERTHLKSVTEFNNIFVETIKQVIPSKLGKSGIDKNGCYAFYLKENQFYIMIQIDPEALINGYFVDYHGNNKPYHSFVVTIHNKSTLDVYKYYKKIDIDDSDFLLK